ncbi:terminase TerL endonuclease subunit [uncultured Brevundimonas sp.]|uniref:terminase TerL endonuclease subunit n=1 Tax=uncultured Brevundimonas sp. TaxID=213418 RepID=UPI0025F10BF8|nr:terminase TerL endonuclease subunit [uncultured Brevundimonas sp.]
MTPIAIGLDHDRAQRNIDWIEKNLKVTVGSEKTPTGSPFQLAEFQKDFIRAVYEPFDLLKPGRRLVTKAAFSVGRKAGKSELAAALVLLHLLGPESETFGSIVSGATTRKQAKMVFNAVVRFLSLSPNLKKHVKIVDSTSTIAVMTANKRCSGSKYEAVAAEAGGAQGLNPSVVIMDELAQATDQGKFYRALEAAQKARSEPFIMVISTQAADPEHTLSQLIQRGLKRREGTTCLQAPNKSCPRCNVHPQIVSHLYAAPEACDLLDPEAHRAANPAIGLWVDADRFMAEAVEAQESRLDEAHFRLYGLNQQVSLTQSLIDMETWRACTDPNLPELRLRSQESVQFEDGEAIYLGLDMSKRTDLTALVAVTAAKPVRVKAWFFKPASDIEKATKRDDEPYQAFVDAGWLIAPPGNDVDPEFVAGQIATLAKSYNVVGLAYDRPYTRDVIKGLTDAGLYSEGSDTGLRLEPWASTNTGMEPAIAALEHHVVNRSLQHDANPILMKHVMNAHIRKNFDDYRRFDKPASRFRIDGAVALALACGIRNLDIIHDTPPNPFEDENFSYFYG